ncbi:MAG: stalk domain-containing protein [Bacillota bacterium]|nr:stalk domain-containing protein [Bacillota bacterium]
MTFTTLKRLLAATALLTSMFLSLPPAVAGDDVIALPPPPQAPGDAPSPAPAQDKPVDTAGPGRQTIRVILYLGRQDATVNGRPVTLDAVPAVDNGVTLVPLRFVSEALGAAVHWDGAAKTITVKGADAKVVLHLGERRATVNGKEVTLVAAPRAEQGRTLVPLRFVGEALSATVHYEQATKAVTIGLTLISKTPPVARFTFARPRVRPGEPVQVFEESSHPEGVPIVDREWTGLENSYGQAGIYQVTLRVKDANGNWSEPFSQKLVVNSPPEPFFTTEKTRYRIGEPVVYRNTSRDPDGHAMTFTWQGNAMAFFESGKHTVSLTAKDELGDTATETVEIEVTDDIYYTKEQFYLLYGGVGAIIPYEEAVLEFPVVNDGWKQSDRVLLRCNNPEKIPGSGILYRDTVSGPARLMIHHLNSSSADIRIWVLARNSGTEPVTVTTTRQGGAGPSKSILQLGRTHLSRFFSAQAPESVTLQPEQTLAVLPAVSAAVIKPGQCFTALADIELSAPVPVEFTFAALAPAADPVKELPQLAPLPGDGHIRGTFPDADRTLTIDTALGRMHQRLLLGDYEHDPPAEGVDALTGQKVQNQGNYGVVYRITLKDVRARTGVLVNARGGVFCGAVALDGKTIMGVPQDGILQPQKWAVILHRQADNGPLTVEFSPPSGSFLPVNLLFAPVPQKKGEVFDPARYVQ